MDNTNMLGDFPATHDGSPRALYLDLMKRCVLNWIYASAELDSVVDEEGKPTDLTTQQKETGYSLVRPRKFDREARLEGKEWPPFAHSMAGLARLENLQRCIQDVLHHNIPGDFIETGVWRGGACIFMRAMLAAFGERNRRVWVADSFMGVPPPSPDKYPADQGWELNRFAQLAVSQEEVAENFRAYGLLDEQVVFLKGWFKDSLPTAPIDRLAILRLDGDLYESTMDGLTSLYEKVSPGGFVIVDDYGVLEPCRLAVEDFRRKHQITEEIHPVDWTCVYWQKRR